MSCPARGRLSTKPDEMQGMAQQLAERLRNKSDKAIAQDLIQCSEVLLNFLNEVIEFSKHAAGDLPVC